MTRTPTPTVTLDGAAVLDEVAAALARYVILPTPEALDRRRAVDRRHPRRPGMELRPTAGHPRTRRSGAASPGCSTWSKRLSWRPLLTANASPSAVYRSIGMTPDDPPTLLDRRGRHDLRPEGRRPRRPTRPAQRRTPTRTARPSATTPAAAPSSSIQTFALAALAGIGAMPDTIEDRAVVIRMRRRAPGELVQPYRVRRDRPALADLKTG